MDAPFTKASKVVSETREKALNHIFKSYIRGLGKICVRLVVLEGKIGIVRRRNRLTFL
ncbi:MAG: hypothetical protein ACTSVM_05980 [Candidatus Ranarchaeia archaeon]